MRYTPLALLNLAIGENDKVPATARHSIRLNRNIADGYAVLAEAVVYGGDLDEAPEAIQHPKRLHPHHPARIDWIGAHVHLQLGDAESARVAGDDSGGGFWSCRSFRNARSHLCRIGRVQMGKIRAVSATRATARFSS